MKLSFVLQIGLWIGAVNSIAIAQSRTIFAVPAAVAGQEDVNIATSEVQGQIDAAAKAGGGVVQVPAGVYHVKPIELQSNVELHLDKGATLLMSRNFEDFPLTWVDDGGTVTAGVESPISGNHLTNVSVTGEGVIDGQGDAWRAVKQSKLSESEWKALVASGGVVNEKLKTWYPSKVVRDGTEQLKVLQQSNAPLQSYAPYRALLRPELVRLVDCTNVKLTGVTFRNSAEWNTHLLLCDHVQVTGVTIFNVEWAQNGDGIDLESCRDVLLDHCAVNAGDDGICLKSGRDEPGRKRGRATENVTVTHCTVGTGHGGLVIGSEMSGGVRHVKVSDCTFTGTANGLRFKSVRGRGGVVEDVEVSNITMRNITGVAILFDLYYMNKATPGSTGKQTEIPPVGEGTPLFRDFKILDITCDGAAQALLVRGLPEMPLQDMSFNRIAITANTAGIVHDGKSLAFHDVHITSRDGSLVSVSDSKGVTLQGCTGFKDQAGASDASH